MRYSAVGAIVTLLVSLLAVPLAAAAPPGKVYRIGYLAAVPPPTHLWEALLDGLRERGYREGQNLVFERRFTEGHAERFPVFAAEMVQRKVDCVIAVTTPAALAVKHASTTIPIVMTTAIDPALRHRLRRHEGGIVRGDQSRRSPWRWRGLQRGCPGAPGTRTGRGLPAAQPAFPLAKPAWQNQPTPTSDPPAWQSGHALSGCPSSSTTVCWRMVGPLCASVSALRGSTRDRSGVRR